MCGPSDGNLVLVGFMGSGKSTIGRELARHSGYQLVDLDALIVSRCGRSIAEIFADEGEDRFRACETEALQSLHGLRRAVVATGGGVVGREENWPLLRRLGTVVYLRARWNTLRGRLSGSQGRPLADDGDWARLHDLWQKRQPLYGLADFAVDTDQCNPAEIAQGILAMVREGSGGCRKR